jgi:hypothetical protein
MLNYLLRKSPNEKCLCAEQVQDIERMFNEIPAIRIAREAFLSMVLASPFTFKIPKMCLASNKDMEKIIIRHWMPWQRAVYDNIKKWGVCPYYFIKPEGQTDHQVPIVPDFKLGYITVYSTDNHQIKFKWYWNHDLIIDKEEKAMLWIISEYAPNVDGTLKSPLASLLPQYRTLLILQQSLERVSVQCANPTHILEYHPAAASAKNDDLTQLVANFGEKAAGLSKARQEMGRAAELRVRTAEIIKQTHRINEKNTFYKKKRVLWTDLEEDQMERADSGFSNVVPLNPDYKYSQAAKASVVAELDKHLTSFNMISSATMDFALEMIQPTGSARTQNVKGGERYENERVKQMLTFIRGITQTALIIAYRPQFEQAFDDVRTWMVNRRGGDPNRVANLCPDLDVEVDMSCTPMVTYDDIKQMWIDGIMSKETFAHHAFHMRSLPHDQIAVTKMPDMVPKELVLPPEPVAKKPKKKNITQ